MKNSAYALKIRPEIADPTGMTPSPTPALLVDLDQYEDPWDHITLKINRKNGTVLVNFNGRASVNIDAITAMELAKDLVDAAIKSLQDPRQRKKKGEPPG